jgi:hypothetical protein
MGLWHSPYHGVLRRSRGRLAMAETSSQPCAQHLPKPFPQWLHRIEDAKSVLDVLLAHAPLHPGDRIVSGCLGFVTGAVSEVEGPYRRRHDKAQGVVEYELRYAHALSELALWLLEPEADRVLGPVRPQDRVQALRLCRMCSEICGFILKWLAQEAVDSCSVDDANAQEEDTQWFVSDSATLAANGHCGPRDLQWAAVDLADGACAATRHAGDGSGR